MSVHSTAIVSPDSEIGSRIEIGPHVIVEPGVVVGDGCWIGAHAVLKRGLRLGKDVRIFEGAVLGGEPQDLKYRPVESFAEVGDQTVIREYATVHRSGQEGGVTRLGRNCFLMAYGHVAHDCDIGDGAIVASYVALAGHIQRRSEGVHLGLRGGASVFSNRRARDGRWRIEDQHGCAALSYGRWCAGSRCGTQLDRLAPSRVQLG